MNHKKTEEHPLRAAILTISNSRTFSDDTNGLLIQSLLAQHGHQVVDYQIVKDDRAEIERHLHEWVCSVDLVITSGGTGIAKRDVTVETVEALFDKTIPAFGEMMTYFAYRRVCGVQAMAYRATAGIIHQCQVYCLPALPSLIKIGMEKIVLPEVFHLYSEIKNDGKFEDRIGNGRGPERKERLCRALRCGPARPSCLCGDATVSDEEMARRIALHQKRRPASWATWEVPDHLPAVLGDLCQTADVVLVDCLTIYFSNYLWAMMETTTKPS